MAIGPLEMRYDAASRSNLGVHMPYVRSSAISRIEWANGTLSIWFHETGRYDYPAVPEKVFHDFLASGSKGTFYNRYIRDHY